MMTDHPFDKLAEQAASGLKGDQELYLDVKQELRSHLEEKAEKFAHDGHPEDESADLAKKSFGSPLDVAADLLNANKRRMKLRALFRLAFGALIVPVAILLALYLGYGRFARLQATLAPIIRDINFLDYGNWSPMHTLPFLGIDESRDRYGEDLLYHLEYPMSYPDRIREYWEAHRQEPDSRIYYAYYALFYKNEDERVYLGTMRLGEQIEPQNALYNVLLAEWYLKRGMYERGEGPHGYDESQKDRLANQRLFDLGIAELRKAIEKPCLRSYQEELLRKKLGTLPRPLLSEDYAAMFSMTVRERFPHLPRYRNLARRIPGSARILMSQGKSAEAEAVMDMWKPYSRLLLSDSDTALINGLLTMGSAKLMTKAAVEVYDSMGAKAKAENARHTYVRLKAVQDAVSKAAHPSRAEEVKKAGVVCEHCLPPPQPFGQHGSYLAKTLLNGFIGRGVTVNDLAPGRMHEHVLAEEATVQALLAVFVLLMIAAILQGFLSLLRLRRAASVPLLLILPAHDILRALLLGILLPMVVYWIYSRLPAIGGRQFGFTSTMHPRFIAEYVILGLAMILIPMAIVRRKIRQRCADLEVPIPDSRQEIVAYLRVQASLLVVVLVAAKALYDYRTYNGLYDFRGVVGLAMGAFPLLLVTALLVVIYRAGKRERIMDWRLRALFLLPAGLLVYVGNEVELWSSYSLDPALRLGGLLLVAAMMFFALRYAIRHRGEHRLYFGTLARSMAPVYALAIIFVSLTIQPWLMYNEAQWLRKDTLIVGYMADSRQKPLALGLSEERVLKDYNADLRKALDGK